MFNLLDFLKKYYRIAKEKSKFFNYGEVPNQFQRDFRNAAQRMLVVKFLIYLSTSNDVCQELEQLLMTEKTMADLARKNDINYGTFKQRIYRNIKKIEEEYRGLIKLIKLDTKEIDEEAEEIIGEHLRKLDQLYINFRKGNFSVVDFLFVNIQIDEWMKEQITEFKSVTSEQSFEDEFFFLSLYTFNTIKKEATNNFIDEFNNDPHFHQCIKYSNYLLNHHYNDLNKKQKRHKQYVHKLLNIN